MFSDRDETPEPDGPIGIVLDKDVIITITKNEHNINELCKQIYANAVSKGFYDKPTSVGERIALIHSELSEALEADRKDLMDDKLTHRTGLEVELADAVIRIFDMAAWKGLDMQGAILEKMVYNTSREYRHGGKKY